MTSDATIDTGTDELLCVIRDRVAVITLNRPEVRNAMSDNLTPALRTMIRACGENPDVGVLLITGAGKAFCAGGDLKERNGMTNEQWLAQHAIFERMTLAILDCPIPVIAAVNGYAIGGGHVLHVICDLTIAADTARFGQVGPKVGSVDPGFGTAYLARVVGEKKAREFWYLCEQYSAEDCRQMGLVNKVVPAAELMNAAMAWARRIVDMSPTAIKIAKQSFNTDSESIRAVGALGITALALYYGTDEAMEGQRAFTERRPPDFRQYRR